MDFQKKNQIEKVHCGSLSCLLNFSNNLRDVMPMMVSYRSYVMGLHSRIIEEELYLKLKFF